MTVICEPFTNDTRIESCQIGHEVRSLECLRVQKLTLRGLRIVVVVAAIVVTAIVVAAVVVAAVVVSPTIIFITTVVVVPFSTIISSVPFRSTFHTSRGGLRGRGTRCRIPFGTLFGIESERSLDI